MNRRSGLFSTSLHTKIPRFRVVCDPRQLDVISHISSALALASQRTQHLLMVRGVFGPLDTTPTSIGTTPSSNTAIPTSSSATPSSTSTTPTSTSITPTSSSATPTSFTSNHIPPRDINPHNNPYHHHNHHYHHYRPIPMVCNEPTSKTGKDRGVHLLPSLLLPPPPLLVTGGAGVGVGMGTRTGPGIRNGQGTGTGVGSGMGNGQVGLLHYPNSTTLPRFSSRKGCTSSSLVHTFQSLYPNPRYSKNGHNPGPSPSPSAVTGRPNPSPSPGAVITSSPGPSPGPGAVNPSPGASAVINPSPSSSAWARALWHHLFDLILSDIRRAKYVTFSSYITSMLLPCRTVTHIISIYAPPIPFIPTLSISSPISSHTLQSFSHPCYGVIYYRRMGRWIELARLISYRKEYAFLYSRFLRPTSSVPTAGGGGSGGGSGGSGSTRDKGLKGSHFVFHIDIPSSTTTTSSSPSTAITTTTTPSFSSSTPSQSSSYETTLAIALARLLHLETILPIHIIVAFRVYARLAVAPAVVVIVTVVVVVVSI